ncbi:GNAT family N-acetyltransferase [Actinacidiphila paucisporea]|uniref:Protein N-acetyltransferase, RimJ/RimL family n=1 Tax=Actinacidiphila paucisporea TaxID=310782 RepID=A0A1M7Q118_9ACTN|nr:GNAT family protein [Actinacidiphila paucisporea]SHN23842.1 Protein N-acetyltransferase, RimJ/RimL family [Actinacidiphila paucisporea]
MTLHASLDGGRLVLTQGRLTLREQLPQDAAQLADGKPAGLTWIDGVPGEGTIGAASMTVAAAAAGLYRPGWGLFAIQRTVDGTAVGGAGFHGPPDGGSVEIGYDLSASGRGAGWATDAARALCQWALSQPEVDLVRATTEPGNAPSQAVLARIGFQQTADRGDLWAYELRGLPV